MILQAPIFSSNRLARKSDPNSWVWSRRIPPPVLFSEGHLHNPVGGAEVGLVDDLGFSIDTGDFPDIVVGSSLLEFFVEVGHEDPISCGVLRKMPAYHIDLTTARVFTSREK